MSEPVHPIIGRYADAEISARKAASLFGDHVSVSEVIVMLHQAGLPPPPQQQRAELAHAKRVLGLD